jgi:uncharacterized protein YecT (DUF1311 family)
MLTKVLISAILLTAGSCSSPSFAQPLVASSASMSRCLDAVVDNEHGSRWPAVLICYEDEVSAQDRRLDALYAKIEAAAPRLGAPAMVQAAAARRAWLQYRDNWCAFERDHAVAPNRDIARLSCLIAVTKDQADRVAEQADAIR